MKNQWISVKDRLPEENEYITGIEMPYECLYACFLYSGHFVSCETDMHVNITHWISLPEPPKE